jgi:hypothetical protein
MGHAFYVQYGVTGYPRELELSAAHADMSIGHIEALAGRLGEALSRLAIRSDPARPAVIRPANPASMPHKERFKCLPR